MKPNKEYIVLGMTFFDIGWLKAVYINMPLSREGFIWLTPMAASGIYCHLKYKFILKRTKTTF